MNDRKERSLLSKLNLPTHLLVAASAWISRIIVTIIQFITIRILLDSLGVENYAVFMLLNGVTGWFMLADMGIGVSVQNYISEARAGNQPYDILIATGAFLATTLLFGMVFLLYFSSPYIGPLFLKNYTYLSNIEKNNLFFATGALSIGTGMGVVIYKIWYAEQKGHLSNIIPAAASVIGLLGLIIINQTQQENRLFLSLIAVMAPTTLLPLLLLIRKLTIHNFRLFPKSERRKTVSEIMKRGSHFWLFSILAAGVLQVDYIVISQFLPPHDVAVYSISTKIFGFAFFVYNAILMALWPVFAEHIAKGKWNEVNKYLRKYLTFGLFFILFCTIALFWLMPIAINILAPRENIIIPTGLIILLGCYQLIRVWADTFSMLLQSMNYLKPMWIFVPLQALMSFTLQWVLAPRFGIYGVVSGLIGSFIFTVVWGFPLATRKIYKISTREAQ